MRGWSFLQYLEAGALLSPGGALRYRLWRVWNRKLPTACFVMLNPSTADGTKDDATVRKCAGFARRWGLGGVEVVNLFAFRATDPKELTNPALTKRELVGPQNDRHVVRAAKRAQGAGGLVVLAWGGNRGAFRFGRNDGVSALLAHNGVRACCLGTTQAGSPLHPLMLPYSAKLRTL